MRIALGVEYDGSCFCGWQRQRNGPSVQSAVESALATVADHPVDVVCAGRTDAGVHARGQVVHMDTAVHRDQRSWVLGANSNLPQSVAMLWARYVDERFHARFSAEARRYRYIILNRPVRPALGTGRVCFEHRPLDVHIMAEGSRHLVGRHDFSAFRAAGCQARHAIRNVQRVDVSRHGDLVVIDVVADGFLHHMVRNMAGTLLDVGAGARPPAWVGEVLATRNRTRGGVTAAAAGLYFEEALYPAAFGLPRPSRRPVGWLALP